MSKSSPLGQPAHSESEYTWPIPSSLPNMNRYTNLRQSLFVYLAAITTFSMSPTSGVAIERDNCFAANCKSAAQEVTTRHHRWVSRHALTCHHRSAFWAVHPVVVAPRRALPPPPRPELSCPRLGRGGALWPAPGRPTPDGEKPPSASATLPSTFCRLSSTNGSLASL